VREPKPWPPAVWFVNVFPAIALSMAIMAMRKTAYGIQTSVYVVYLKQVGPVGTTIGILFGAPRSRARPVRSSPDGRCV